MKKNIWISIHKFLKMGLLSYALLLSSLSGVTSITVDTHAASSKCIPLLCTPTPIPTPTLTPTPTPSPTPTPTQPPKPTPTPQVQSQPINVVYPVTPVATDTPTPVVTPTATAIPTATATVTPNKAMTTPDTPNQQSQGDQGINMFMLSLGIGAPLLLLSGGMFWILWKRQMNQHQPAMQGAFRNAVASPWMNNHGVPPTPDVSQYTSSTTPGASGALPVPGSPQPMPSPQIAYTPSDLRPMTSAFPQQMLNPSPNNGASPLQNGDLMPLPMDTLNLPLQSSRARAASRNGHKPATPAPLPPLMDTPTPSMSSPLPALVDTPMPSMSSPLPVPPPAGQPPSIKDDPLLEEVMRQAQMGLFALGIKRKSIQEQPLS